VVFLVEGVEKGKVRKAGKDGIDMQVAEQGVQGESGNETGTVPIESSGSAKRQVPAEPVFDMHGWMG
jgi:hypothetical protein